MTWISTNRGKKIDFLNPDPAEICIEDIADGLSRAARFAGHCYGFYSVAQHSVLASRQIPDHQLELLLHDSHEAYTGDLPAPLKRLLTGIDEIQDLLDRAIGEALGVDLTCLPEVVRIVDRRLLVTEKRDLQPRGIEWEGDWPKPFEARIIPTSAHTAKVDFMKRYRELTECK